MPAVRRRATATGGKQEDTYFILVALGFRVKTESLTHVYLCTRGDVFDPDAESPVPAEVASAHLRQAVHTP